MNEVISIKDLTKKYQKKVILKDINLTINQGDAIAVTGSNGIGKSTLLKIISGLVKPTSGSVFK